MVVVLGRLCLFDQRGNGGVGVGGGYGHQWCVMRSWGRTGGLEGVRNGLGSCRCDMEICVLETALAGWVTWRVLGWEVSERVCRRWWWIASGCGDIAGVLDFFLTQVSYTVAGFLIPDTDEVLQIDGVAELLTQVGSEQSLAESGGTYMIQKSLDRCRCDLEDMLLEENAGAVLLGRYWRKRFWLRKRHAAQDKTIWIAVALRNTNVPKLERIRVLGRAQR